MNKSKKIIGIFNILFAFLFFIQIAILKIYNSFAPNHYINIFSSISIFSLLFISGFLLFFDGKFKHNLLSNIAIILLLIETIINYMNKNTFDKDYLFSNISILNIILIVFLNLYSKRNIKKHNIKR